MDDKIFEAIYCENKLLLSFGEILRKTHLQEARISVEKAIETFIRNFGYNGTNQDLIDKVAKFWEIIKKMGHETLSANNSILELSQGTSVPFIPINDNNEEISYNMWINQFVNGLNDQTENIVLNELYTQFNNIFQDFPELERQSHRDI